MVKLDIARENSIASVWCVVRHFTRCRREDAFRYFDSGEVPGGGCESRRVDDEDGYEENSETELSQSLSQFCTELGTVNEDREKFGYDDDTEDNVASTSIATVAAVHIFSTYAEEQLFNPIEINKLPDAFVRDAYNLHTLIDPYQLLLRTYDIERDVSVNLTDIAMANFLRNFLDESGSNVTRSNIRDLVNKMKERIRMDYPFEFRADNNVFNLIFKECRRRR